MTLFCAVVLKQEAAKKSEELLHRWGEFLNFHYYT